MKTLTAMTMVAALTAAGAKAADAPGPAAIAAGQWVTTVDDANYARSWDEAGALFKNRLTQDEWTHQVAKARGPLG